MFDAIPAKQLILLATQIVFVNSALAQAKAPGFPAPTNAVPPTVTVRMGDVGGKLFGRPPEPERTRRYYIAAEPQLWDFTPEGRDPVCGKPFPQPLVQQRNAGKVRYIEYADESFTVRVLETPRLGIMGPVLRGTVGQNLAVTFLNRTSFPLSMHPHGVKYDKDSEGSYYAPKPGLGAAVGPGATFTYVWELDEASGPQPGEPSSKAWLYHSHVNGDEEANMGLIGAIIVTDPRRARPDGTPNDVDREMAALFMIFDESGLGAAEKEAAEYATVPGNTGLPPKPWAQVQEILEQGERATINGYLFGNLPGLDMIEGERVRWYLLGLGGQHDFHTAHWHGARVVEDGRRRTDSVELLPASMKVADMVADNPGQWLFHCHVAEHMQEGMFARFTIHPKGTPGASATLAHPFFGLRQAQSSLQIKQASLSTGAKITVSITGSVTVFQAFSVFTQPIAVRIGDTTMTFKTDRRGVAQTGSSTFRATNASPFGVVYGGLMEFELVLAGDEWSAELQKLGGSVTGIEVTIPLSMEIGKAKHRTPATLRVNRN